MERFISHITLILKLYRLLFPHLFRMFLLPGLILSLLCSWFIFILGRPALGSILWIKLIGVGAVFLFFHLFNYNQWYFFHNLGIGKRRLIGLMVITEIILSVFIFTIALALHGST